MTEPRVALVTGSARRIGAAIVRTLHAGGFAVAVHCRNSRREADALAAELNDARTDSAIVVQADINDTKTHTAIIAGVIDAFGRLDLLVNNASTFHPTPMGEITENDWNDLVGSNLKAPLFLIQAALPQLRRSNGNVINMIDIHVERPLRDHPVYLAAKGGLLTLTHSLAKDLAPGVRVNGISPGAILWPETGQDDDLKQAVIDATPMQRIGSPRDIADTVLFLARNRFITGQVINVDGGRSL